MTAYDNEVKMAAEELVQLREAGCDISALQAIHDTVKEMPPDNSRAVMDEFWHLARHARPTGDFPFEEPSELVAIRALRPDGPRCMGGEVDERRILGAWLGRCVGCMLGKPVELKSREVIEQTLRSADAWPLDDYFPPLPDDTGESPYRSDGNTCLRGNIHCAQRDDDTDYTILGLHLLETRGPDFTSAQVGEEWLLRLPYMKVYTAERAAYRNLVNGIGPPETAFCKNPYREWIGAQIRADAFGYVAPGRPETAAELAFRDAALSHAANGIYGEMFFAALIAACLATDDLQEAIDAALAEIPANCRLAAAVADVRAWCCEDAGWEATCDRIMEKYGHYHPVHTINNAALVLMGLLHSGGDFSRAIAISVMGGLDTDCNGATAGSVMGALVGPEGIAQRWIAPLNDTLHSALDGMNVNRISDLAARTATVARAVAMKTKK